MEEEEGNESRKKKCGTMKERKQGKKCKVEEGKQIRYWKIRNSVRLRARKA